MKINHEAALIAAEWWANKISGNCKHDNGDSSLNSFLANRLADMLNVPVSDEQLEKFKDILSSSLEKGEIPHVGFYIDLYCDYGPDRTLREAADAAGISTNNFPFKTCMFLNEKEVKVRDGYGATYQVLWSAQE